MQMEVPSSLKSHNKWVCRKIRHGRFLLTRAKPTEIMGLRFCCRSVRMRSCAQFSFYDRQNSHFMTYKFHFMTEPTPPPRRRRRVGSVIK